MVGNRGRFANSRSGASKTCVPKLELGNELKVAGTFHVPQQNASEKGKPKPEKRLTNCENRRPSSVSIGAYKRFRVIRRELRNVQWVICGTTQSILVKKGNKQRTDQTNRRMVGVSISHLFAADVRFQTFLTCIEAWFKNFRQVRQSHRLVVESFLQTELVKFTEPSKLKAANKMLHEVMDRLSEGTRRSGSDFKMVFAADMAICKNGG